MLRGVRRDEVRRGQVLAAPGTESAHRQFVARVYFLTAEEGGRHKPVLAGYRPQFYLRTTDVPGRLDLDRETQPGETVEVRVELEKPVALAPGLGFALREGGLTVGAGSVVDILDRRQRTPAHSRDHRHFPAT